MTNLIAYHNDPDIKADILAQLNAHAAADEIVKGQYWEDGKGCAVGCTIHGDDHMEYEARFGIPMMLARLEDCIFEGMPNKEAKLWPMQFMDAIQPGSDLSLVGWKFLHWLITDCTVNPGITHPSVKDAIKVCADVIEPLARGEPIVSGAAESAAESAARSAESAWSAARSAAESAAESAARSAESAWSAARSAAASAAESAAESAAGAAWSAAWSAERSAAWSAASGADYRLMSDKLIELIKEAGA